MKIDLQFSPVHENRKRALWPEQTMDDVNITLAIEICNVSSSQAMNISGASRVARRGMVGETVEPQISFTAERVMCCLKQKLD